MTEDNDPTIMIRVLLASALIVAIVSIMVYIKLEYHPLIAFICPLIIAFISLGIAWLSEKRMVILSRADIIGVIRALERARFNFFNKMHRFRKEYREKKSEQKPNQQLIDELIFESIQILEIAAWESLQCLRQAYVLKKWALEEHKNSLSNGVYILISNVFEFTKMGVVTNRHVSYLLQCCEELDKLGISDSWKTRIVCLLQKSNVGEMKPSDEDFEGYIKRKRKQIVIDSSGKYPKEQFMGMAFKGMS